MDSSPPHEVVHVDGEYVGALTETIAITRAQQTVADEQLLVGVMILGRAEMAAKGIWDIWRRDTDPDVMTLNKVIAVGPTASVIPSITSGQMGGGSGGGDAQLSTALSIRIKNSSHKYERHVSKEVLDSVMQVEKKNLGVRGWIKEARTAVDADARIEVLFKRIRENKKIIEDWESGIYFAMKLGTMIKYEDPGESELEDDTELD